MRLPALFFSLSLFTLPWVGIGTFELLGLPSVGGGFQPSLLFAWATLCSALLLDRKHPIGAMPASLLAAAGFTCFSACFAWTLTDMGLFGEEPWSKSAKQVVMLVLYLGVALAPAAVLRAERRADRLVQWERALSLGLLVAAAYGLLQAFHYYVPLPAMERADDWFSSNPSIAAGSHELYLGHRFVGIPRIRSTACEPLYFGSYLLVAVPICALGLRRSVGFARAWRVLAFGLGCATLVMTFSRGVYAAATAGAVAGCIVWFRAGRPALVSRAQLFAYLGLLAAVALLVSMLSGTAPWALPGLLLRRTLQTFAEHDMSNLTRFFAWEVAWDAFLSRPLFGHGWGTFGFLYYPLAPAEGAAAHFGWPVVNNVLLRVLAETGVVGLALWSWVLAAPVRRLGESLLGSPVGGPTLLFGLLLLTGFVQSLSHSQLQLPHLWLVAGLAVYFGRRGRVVV